MERKIGKIIKWDNVRGYGFVKTGNGRGYFLHITNWESDETPEVGMSVSFEIGDDIRTGKSQCVNTRIHDGIAALVGVQ